MGESFRIKNRWGPTTGKHINNCCNMYETILEPDEFERRLNIAYRLAVLEEFRELHVKRLSGERIIE
jgi:hypothetical protein